MKTSPQSVYIEFMGCPKRGLDATKFKNYFLANGVNLKKQPHKADCILYVSCAFRKERQEGAVRRIKQLKQYKGELIVAGCLKAINHDLLKENFQGKSLTTARPDQIDSIFPHFKVSFKDIPEANAIHPISKLALLKENIFALRFDFNFLKRTIFYLKRRFTKDYCHIQICWGCEKEHCAFCVIWRAVGPLRSKTIEKCLAELKEALRKGKMRIILLANNTGAYGSDIGTTLPDLLEAMLGLSEDFTIEIEDLHPFWLIKYRERMIKLLRTKRIVALHCPIQSANNRMLTLMNRRYAIEDAKKALLALKEVHPPLEINTQILIGFFSETEEDFQETLAFLTQVKFKLVQIYGYTKHSDERLLPLLDSEVSSEVIRQRLKKAVRFCKKNKIICASV
jgi:threonylcarbamoyladenosine tRNA methylthiotransferase CDKAL1